MATLTMAPAAARPAAADRLVDAAKTALVAAVLAVPFLGLTTVDQGGRLGIETRWWWVVIAVAVVFVGRLLLGLMPRGARAAARPAAMAPVKAAGGPAATRWIGWGVLAFAAALPFLPFTDARELDLGITVLIYIMLGWGLNVVVGLAGLLDLGYVAFYAVGAYSYALLSQTFGLSFWECLPIAGAMSASFGILLGFPVLRLRGDYLAIVTLGFGEMIRIILLNWTTLTGGPNGIGDISPPSFFGFPFRRTAAPGGPTPFHQLFGLDYSSQHRQIFQYFLILALALLTNLLVSRLRRLPVGRAWEALREDEIACRSLGINPTMVKLSAFALGAMLGGFAGSFFATKQGFISPESFTFIESAIILAIVVLGGMGSQLGVVAAALFLVLLPEFGREFAQFRMLVFGAAMILIMVWRPQGMLAHREPTIRLPARPEARPGSGVRP